MANQQELAPIFAEEQDKFIVTDLGLGTWEDWNKANFPQDEFEVTLDEIHALQVELDQLASRNKSLEFIALVAGYCRDIAIIVGIVYFFAQ